ncbi:hypothetical protein KIH74_06445 [Kineosporia sp. J2-2]|uniref:beta-mannosidase n=1 Tax=Kineosporia corallincola TaxID=2835133 RepID=A0ABS5TBV2_9ACTN|nr:glycoside hydrolase family 2 TIM barrel-domain containing protein [Kineosporia corallincola]MBT0768557.1 hypothetical protein [Kineosporia corallincola]
MKHQNLSSGWTVAATAGPVPEAARGPVPAAVPGCVHTDLLAVGAIAEPYDDANESGLEWFHHSDWRYTTMLEMPAPAEGERVDLVFDGIDTVSTVRLGDAVLGRTENMHRGYRFDVTQLITGSEQTLTVDIASATAHAEALRGRLGDRPGAYAPRPFNFVRKMACSFGWDWGPDLRTAGLWKPVRVERWSTARLARVRPLTGVAADGAGTVEVHVDLERSGLEPAAAVRVRAQVLGVSVATTVPAGEDGAVLTLRVPGAPLWWPTGHGEQPLAELTVHLGDDEEPLDRWSRRIGFRTVEIDTGDDENGTRFTILVNGRPIAVRGANWIPDDHFVTRITRERVARRIGQALGANLNLLRVWGGGVYESDDFYELCDEHGVLVWQDFLLACAAYPEEEPLRSEIEAEARENVVRLMPHPSLVLWNGGNENLWGHEDWGWKQLLGDATWGKDYAEKLFADVLAELDPTRPYSPNSPSTPRRTPGQAHPNDPDHGTHHQWDVWNRIDWSAYSSEIPRFCSEFGFQGPPAWRTLTDHVHAEDGGPLTGVADPCADPVFLVHQKADDGTGKLDRGMAPHTGVPADFEDWHWAAQLNQARAVRHAVRHYRSWWPRTAGWIVWQVNDCWPVVSWALVDSEERPKPVYFAVREASAPRAVFIMDEDGDLSLVVVNDTDEPWEGESDTRLETFAGDWSVRERSDVSVAPRSVEVLPLPADLSSPGDRAGEVVVAEFDGERVVHTFDQDVDLNLHPDPLEVTAEKVDGGYRIDVLARELALDVTVLPDRLAGDARVDDAVVSLPAGARASFLVTTAAELDPASLTGRPVLRTANDLRAVTLRDPAGPVGEAVTGDAEPVTASTPW